MIAGGRESSEGANVGEWWPVRGRGEHEIGLCAIPHGSRRSWFAEVAPPRLWDDGWSGGEAPAAVVREDLDMTVRKEDDQIWIAVAVDVGARHGHRTFVRFDRRRAALAGEFNQNALAVQYHSVGAAIAIEVAQQGAGKRGGEVIRSVRWCARAQAERSGQKKENANEANVRGLHP